MRNIFAIVWLVAKMAVAHSLSLSLVKGSLNCWRLTVTYIFLSLSISRNTVRDRFSLTVWKQQTFVCQAPLPFLEAVFLSALVPDTWKRCFSLCDEEIGNSYCPGLRLVNSGTLSTDCVVMLMVWLFLFPVACHTYWARGGALRHSRCTWTWEEEPLFDLSFWGG